MLTSKDKGKLLPHHFNYALKTERKNDPDEQAINSLDHVIGYSRK
eukprot:XP_001709539.1 Hypothetical protein GL50803_29130 [Giardia lamblia ATCC 50803]